MKRTEEEKKIHKENKQTFLDAFNKLTSEDKSSRSKRDIGFDEIPKYIKEGKLSLDTTIYHPKQLGAKCGYGKNLIFDYYDSEGPLSAFCLPFGRGNETAIHDHTDPCVTIVLTDTPIKESTYKVLSIENKVAEKIETSFRKKFDIKKDEEPGSFVHRLKYAYKNEDKGTATTLHIYKMPAKNVIRTLKRFIQTLKILGNLLLTALKNVLKITNKMSYVSK
jgi:hypothetical protein